MSTTPPRPPQGQGDPGDVPFWEELYQREEISWDLGEPAPPFVDLLARPDAPTPGKMIVLGCGRGHDAILFARHGFDVTAVDFAPSAIAATRDASMAAGVPLSLVQHDIFTLGGEYNGRFDYALEHTCFAAVPITMHELYPHSVARLLKPGGLLVAIFFAHGRPGGPPFTTNMEEVRELFSPYFKIEELQVARRSARWREGKELFALLRRVESEAKP